MQIGNDEVSLDPFTARLDYPMYVLTVQASDGTGPAGCLVGFATQSSITPPRFLVCLSKVNHTYRAARGATSVALHALSATDRDLAVLFGTHTGDEIDKFARCDWRLGPEGLPLLSRCPTWLVGSIEARADLGDHEGLLLRPTHTGPGADTRPLMFSAVTDLEAGHPA